MAQICVSFTDETKKEIDRLAAEDERSRSKTIELIVKDAIERMKQE